MTTGTGAVPAMAGSASDHTRPPPAATPGLTVQQSALLAFLRVQQAAGRTPSFDEMRAELGVSSSSSVHRLVEALTERGFIERIRNRARALRVLEQPRMFGVLAAIGTADLVAELRRRGVQVPG